MTQSQRVWMALLAALLIGQAAPLYANVESFRNTIEASEAEKRRGPGYSDSSSNAGTATTDYGLLGELIAQLLILLWLPDNFFFTYGLYPYDEDGFIQRPSTPEAYEFFNFNKKNYSFSVGLTALHLGGIGAGTWVSFSGNIFKFFGPYLDAYILTDTEQILGGGRAGLHFSLIQSNWYNLAWYAQWQGWSGVLSRHAFVTGFETRLYPVKPLTIRLKAGLQAFSNLSLGELEGEIGALLAAWEFFIGYRYWGISDEQFSNSPWHGPYLGLRYYF